MAVASFQALCEQVCTIFGVAPPDLQADLAGLTGFTLQLGDVEVCVAQAPGGPMPAVFVLVEFGPPPAGRELQTWHALLDANFLMLGANAPGFSRNPVTGDVVLQYACTLNEATPEGLCASIRAIADVATHWRQGHFLGESPPQEAPGAPDGHQDASAYV